MRILIAPQEFKGTLTARGAAEAMATGARRALPDADLDLVPVSDGGPGFVEAMLASVPGRAVNATVRGPLGRPVEASWGLLDDRTAVIEMAAAAGLTLLEEGQRDPRRTSTHGVGELMRAALDTGARRIVVGVGGSATNDGGAGMAQALGARLLDAGGRDLPTGGAALAALSRIDISGLDARLGEVDVIAATDVLNPLCGPDGASLVYGPQKGATVEVARELDAALRRYGELVERDLGVPVLDVPGAGAAGGLTAGLIAFCRATVRPGFEIIAEASRLAERVRHADLVLTGEGRIDRQTAFGKAVARVGRLARDHGVPVIAVAGALGDGWGEVLHAVDAVEPVVGGAATLEDALARPRETLALTTHRAIAGWVRIAEITGREQSR